MKCAFPFLIALGLSPVFANPGGLDGATSHIYQFDGDQQTFELLKETEYNPQTETTRSRYTVHSTDETKERKFQFR